MYIIYQHLRLILIEFIIFFKTRIAYLHDIDAHGCERQTEHQVYY